MILIIAAMMEELDALKKLGENIHETSVEDIHVVEMTLGDKPVILSLSGVGKVNAAYTTTLLSSVYKPTLIINIGSAGGLQPDQSIGDIVIANQVRAHDLDIGPNTIHDERFIYMPHHDYAHLALSLTKALDIQGHVGEIVSGDQFVSFESDALIRIQNIFPDAICVEMEASAIGGVSKRLKIPFVILRSLSDVPLREGNDITFEAFLPTASRNSALLTEKFIKSI
ncbi:MAG: 5'-methylthioadenosine/adenosylhomocysteine nucleosidase [Erysipelothrix sp.]|nr:5'-methylthioadenosine/adenosylhomocysteine nucleosidase [Erysipelothrix sp.]